MGNLLDEQQMAGYVDAMESQSNVNTLEATPINMPVDRTPLPIKERPMPQMQQMPQQAYQSPIDKSNLAGRGEKIQADLNRIGYHVLPINTLPTGGMFYPDDFEVSIRAARGEEIKHWSTMNESDLMSVNNATNFIIERCVNIKSSNGASWRDLKTIDKFYVLLAIRELTFVDNEGNLEVPIAEGKNIPVHKEMIHYVEIPEEIMKHYSKEERCFVFKLKKTGNVIRIYVPSLGIDEWLSSYVSAKDAAQQQIDTDYIQFAPLLIPDYKGLNQKKYEDYVVDSHAYGQYEWALISKIKDMFQTIFMPSFKYTREDGTEVEVPISFRGGIKSIFSISTSISELCGD